MKNKLKFIALIICSLIVIQSISQNAKSLKYHKIKSGKVIRNYLLHIPKTIDHSKPFPLLIGMHGLGGNAKNAAKSGMNQIANNECFAVCYPNGFKKKWNAGNKSFDNKQNDVAFIIDLIEDISKKYNIDQNAIFTYGMSNGGFMSYKLACEIPDKIAGIASVTGSMSPELYKNCNPEKLIPILQIHGTADEIVPFFHEKPYSIPVKSVLNFWVKKQNCNKQIKNRKYLSDCTLKKAATSVPQKCSSSIKLINVKEGKHAWFCFSNQEIWNFFSEQIPQFQ